MQKQYDYIFTGAGCAGLSLLVRILRSQKFSGKKILVIDKAPKQQNDRTWSFWEKEAGYFENIVYKKWNRFYFHANGFSKLSELNPYQYKMIRGIDFYEYCFTIINSYKNVEVVYESVNNIKNTGTLATVTTTAGNTYTATKVFNSIIFEKPLLKHGQYYLLQHFKGWIVETSTPCFDATTAVFMDFRVPQNHGTTFVYVMPFSQTKALIEYTLFTEKLLAQADYEAALTFYLRNFINTPSYKIIDEEFGIIPMTNYPFSPGKENIINLGTAGAQTKASSGYTFQFIQKHSNQLLHALENNTNLFLKSSALHPRFNFYDSVLLNILANKKLDGADIFKTLFQKNNTLTVLQFLDNETSLLQDVALMQSLPTLPFAAAAFQNVFGR
jgi:lycopene beta-cyclase